MHRDAKLGLALGILVIGFAAAFCFPRHAGLPAHARAGGISTSATSDLDERLALRSVRVYTNARHPAESEEPGPTSPPLHTAASSPAPEPDDGVSVDRQHLASSAADRLNPVRVAPKESSNPPAAAEEQNDPVFDDAEPVGVTHTVRPGDTLSSIALQHLGGSTRYSEIFELNHDLLASPDALQIGMELKIPPKTRIRSSVPGDAPARSTPTQIADSRTDHRAEIGASRDGSTFRRVERQPSAAHGIREPEPTPAEPFLPTTAIPATNVPSGPPTPASGGPPARRGAASVGAILRGRRA